MLTQDVSLDELGFEIIPDFLPQTICHQLLREIEGYEQEYPAHGIRNAEKKFTGIQNLVHSALLLSKAREILGSEPELVRVIVFDKTPDKNWLVTWHQDKTIAVNHQEDLPGWGPWSLKAGIPHVQPPLEILEKMITFRLHLDDADESNGCLKVLPGTHQLGILSQEEIQQARQGRDAFPCELKAGGLLIMRPHLLHASSKALKPDHRRVIHIEYSNASLPNGLKWA